MSLNTKTLSQLLDEPDDGRGEAEYRRGAVDIIGQLFLAVEVLPSEISKSDLEESLWRWWQSLLRWQGVPASQEIEPPAIEWQ